MRCAPSQPAGSAGRVPAARRDELDRLRQCLKLDWLDICPATGTGVKLHADDLFQTPLDQSEIDFENEGGETYICGNPPYRMASLGSRGLRNLTSKWFSGRILKQWKSLDYVAAWFMKAAEYGMRTRAATAFVSYQFHMPRRTSADTVAPDFCHRATIIAFAHTSFKWANLASHNAGVTVSNRWHFQAGAQAQTHFFKWSRTAKSPLSMRRTSMPILVPGSDVIVRPIRKNPSGRCANGMGKQANGRRQSCAVS